MLDAKQKCPNCYSDQFIRTEKPIRVHELFWYEPAKIIIVMCSQCGQTIYKTHEAESLK